LSYGSEDLEYVKDLHLSDFAIFFELEMDDEERAELNQDMSIAIEKGYIGLEDKYKIRNFKVLNLAIQYLTVLVKSVQRLFKSKSTRSKTKKRHGYSQVNNLINLHNKLFKFKCKLMPKTKSNCRR
jgi:hypothetical protein